LTIKQHVLTGPDARSVVDAYICGR
jgi:hypothetical protein